MSKQAPRGIRNNNPGNIDYNERNPWQGLDKQKPSDGRFCRFMGPEWGIRAITRVIRNYAKRDGTPGVGGKGIDTVQEIIHRWAPPTENDTGAYVAQVAKVVGVSPTEPLNLDDDLIMAKLVTAIIWHENGVQPYSAALILAGVKLA